MEIINNIPNNNNQLFEASSNNTTNKEIIPIIDFQPLITTKSTITPIINNQKPDFIINNELNTDTELIVTDKKRKNKKPTKITTDLQVLIPNTLTDKEKEEYIKFDDTTLYTFIVTGNTEPNIIKQAHSSTDKEH